MVKVVVLNVATPLKAVAFCPHKLMTSCGATEMGVKPVWMANAVLMRHNTTIRHMASSVNAVHTRCLYVVVYNAGTVLLSFAAFR